MSKVIGNTFYLQSEASDKCEICGKVAELRPYGPNGENICFSCGMKDEETTKAQFNKMLNGVEKVVVVPPNATVTTL